MGVTILNKLYGTLPLFAHAPGIPENNPLWTDVVRYANQGKPQRFTQPAGVTFITWNSGLPNSFISQHKKTLGTFEKSMERVGLEYVVLGKGVGSGWVNTMKLTTTCDFLDHCGTEYVSGIDSADAVVVADPADIVTRFKEYGCDLLYGAEMNFWPDELANTVKPQEERRFRKPYCYLNGGMWIGQTEYCRRFFRSVLELRGRIKSRPLSEQMAIKSHYVNCYPQVQLDDRCNLFQNLILGNSKTIKVSPTGPVKF